MRPAVPAHRADRGQRHGHCDRGLPPGQAAPAGPRDQPPRGREQAEPDRDRHGRVPVVPEFPQHLDEQPDRQDRRQDGREAGYRALGHVLHRPGVTHHDESAATSSAPAAGLTVGQLMSTTVP
jgi:hypothetical protein